MELRFDIGQRVKIVTLIDGYGRPDPRVTEWVGKTGEVVNYYYISGNEIWEKTLKIKDVYSYDISLDDGGDIVRGIPELDWRHSYFNP